VIPVRGATGARGCCARCWGHGVVRRTGGRIGLATALRLVAEPDTGECLAERPPWPLDRGQPGGAQAEGDWPSFTEAQWVRTHGVYGHGCACVRVVADARTQRVTHILSATAKPLAACRQDRHLREPPQPE